VRSLPDRKREVKPGGHRLAGVRCSVSAWLTPVDGPGVGVCGDRQGPVVCGRPSSASRSPRDAARGREDPRCKLGWVEVGARGLRAVVGLLGGLVGLFGGVLCVGAVWR